MDDYKIIIEQEHQTVMAHDDVGAQADGRYQSEANLEHREKQYEYYRNKLLTFE